MMKKIHITFLICLFYCVNYSFAQNFITREGSLLKYQEKEILLRGFAFGNRVWVDDPLPTQHHNEDDYIVLKDLGMNAIRFYLNYITFEDDQNPYTYKEAGWGWIDQNIEWAKKHDIFLILNMHVPQGGFQSQCDGAALWEIPENQTRLAALWKAIAARYKDEPQIAGYDIVNEPTPKHSVEEWSVLAQRIIDSIRTVDQNHLIITERAIAVDCDYGHNDGNYNYPAIEEENLMYTVHLYDPYEYTHQNQAWANTGDGGKYPDENIIIAPNDAAYNTGQYANPSIQSGTSDWTYYEGQPYLVENEDIIMGRVVFTGGMLGEGVAYYDDIRLVEVDNQGNEIKEIFNTTLTAAEEYWVWSELEDGVMASTTAGRTGNYAISLTGTASYGSITTSSLTFIAEQGKRYKISGWMRGENIPANASALITTEFYTSPSGQKAHRRNKEYLRARILEYSDYVRARNFPVYYGEFGVVRNAFQNNKGGHIWVRDVMDIFDSLGFHFTYHTYREDGFGFYAGWDGAINRNTKLVDLEEEFKDFFLRTLNLDDQLENERLTTIFPNPFYDVAFIHNTYDQEIEIVVYDSKGVKYEKLILTPNQKHYIGEKLPNGIFLIKMKVGESYYYQKIIKRI